MHQGATAVIQWTIATSLRKYAGLAYWMKADDLTFVVPANLRTYVDRRNSSTIEMMGRRLSMPDGKVFCSGGAGYILSRGAINFLTQNWCEGVGWYKSEGGDIALTQCIGEGNVVDTRDGSESGGERFHAYGPQRVFSGSVDKWYRDYTAKWYSIPSGLGCCAKELITFHYIESGEAKALWEVLQNRPSILKKSDSERLDFWPKKGPELSYYSTKPTAEDGMWSLLLEHMNV